MYSKVVVLTCYSFSIANPSLQLIKRTQQAQCDQKYKTESSFDPCVSFSFTHIRTINTFFFTSASNESQKDQIGRKRAEQQGRQSEGERERVGKRMIKSRRVADIEWERGNGF